MSMIKTKLNYFSVELDKESTQSLKTKLLGETIEIHNYTYKIKAIENNANASKYQMLPIALSSGIRNCFTPIIWIEILDLKDMSKVSVTFRAYTAVEIMLAIFGIGALMIATATFAYLLYCVFGHRSIFNLKVLKVFASFLKIPLIMFIVFFITFRNVKKALNNIIKNV